MHELSVVTGPKLQLAVGLVDWRLKCQGVYGPWKACLHQSIVSVLYPLLQKAKLTYT